MRALLPAANQLSFGFHEFAQKLENQSLVYRIVRCQTLTYRCRFLHAAVSVMIVGPPDLERETPESFIFLKGPKPAMVSLVS